MTEFIKILNKIKSRGLFFSIIQILLVGWDNQSRRIITLGAMNNSKKRLKKKYGKTKDRKINSVSNFVNSGKIWLFWGQGYEEAPEVVKVCAESIIKNFPNREIVFLDFSSIFNYINLPDYIIEKFKKGVIGYAHFSDLIRLELLTNYGGIWIDSTVFVSAKIPQSIEMSKLFFYQSLSPGRPDNVLPVSSWFLVCQSPSKILNSVKYNLFEYWKDETSNPYFLFHMFLVIACENYPDEYESIPKYSNQPPHILQYELFRKYEEVRWKEILKMTDVHKLSYKLTNDKLELNDTFYERIIRRKNVEF